MRGLEEHISVASVDGCKDEFKHLKFKYQNSSMGWDVDAEFLIKSIFMNVVPGTPARKPLCSLCLQCHMAFVLRIYCPKLLHNGCG